MRSILAILRDRKGATAIEYGLLCAIICIAMIGALTNVTTSLGVTFGRIGNVFVQ